MQIWKKESLTDLTCARIGEKPLGARKKRLHNFSPVIGRWLIVIGTWEEYVIPNPEPAHIPFEISNQTFALSIYVTILREKVRC